MAQNRNKSNIKAQAVVDKLLEDVTQKIQCRNGWIYVKPMHGRFYITATGQKAVTVDAAEKHDYVNELIRELGGKIY